LQDTTQIFERSLFLAKRQAFAASHLSSIRIVEKMRSMYRRTQSVGNEGRVENLGQVHRVFKSEY
jgi:transcription initiation factor TFIID subunit TAF12